MPKPLPHRNTIFNAPFDALSTMRSDGFTVPHYNSSPTDTIFPGEPFLKTQGSSQIVVIAQGEIPPQECRTVVRQWEADFPCDFSADVKDGDEVYWDVDNEVVSLVGDVTNGFSLGNATFAVEPGQNVTADDDDRPVVATSTSTRVCVVHSIKEATSKGTVSVLSQPKKSSSFSSKAE